MRVVFYIEKLNDPNTWQFLRQQLRGKFAGLTHVETGIELVDMFEGAIQYSALEVVGKQKMKKQVWITENPNNSKTCHQHMNIDD